MTEVVLYGVLRERASSRSAYTPMELSDDIRNRSLGALIVG